MNIWTVFFLVVSAVILASPLLFSSSGVRSDPDGGHGQDGWPDWEDNELELDLASGRMTQEDYEVMTGQEKIPAAKAAGDAEGDDGNLPEG